MVADTDAARSEAVEEHEREHGAAGRARGGPARGTRRQLMRGLLAPALAVALAPLVAASRPEPHPAEPEGDGTFDETYRGRRIRGVRSAAGRAVGAGSWHVTVDGRPLHLMRRADGSWLTMVDHYRSYPTPLAAARGAVDELGPGEHLRDTPSAEEHDHHSGGRHGVHA
ncbi:tyrosinase cofactor [Streptomyces parvulus]|uniref:Tyrosinase n=1 Tax=Streptomyces parvulus TaxID=146923 RepID=A0A191UXT8_9ACTN|nr:MULTISPECIES: tyrosinase cofactor [Streptomyces]ANJ07554.1 tyrosinase [Streptomyces parvulus]MCC9155309.1 tyrosinase cofactor [Streptomyces parvulus]MCE7685472.1 tyrosinase cofactor [Streptomyces parvulus]MCQ4197490.1 tyrosinase cofactor [Streptomyces parvulus]MZD55319.1 tyrosinase [Streptomyces sp. SID5606]